MTSLLAIGCDEGVVMACDSAHHNLTNGTKFLSDKIERVGPNSMIAGMCGNAPLAGKVVDALQVLKPFASVDDLCVNIQKHIAPIIIEFRNLWVPWENGDISPMGMQLLLAGVLNREPWILIISENADVCHVNKRFDRRYFLGTAASGQAAFFNQYKCIPRTLETCKLMAYRATDTTIMAIDRIQGPIHIHSVTNDGTVSEVGEEEIARLASRSKAWVQREIELFQELCPVP